MKIFWKKSFKMNFLECLLVVLIYAELPIKVNLYKIQKRYLWYDIEKDTNVNHTQDVLNKTIKSTKLRAYTECLTECNNNPFCYYVTFNSNDLRCDLFKNIQIKSVFDNSSYLFTKIQSNVILILN